MAERWNDSFTWQIVDANGRVAAEARGASLSVVLSPGRYRARAATDETTFMRDFSVAAGTSIEVVLGRGENSDVEHALAPVGHEVELSTPEEDGRVRPGHDGMDLSPRLVEANGLIRPKHDVS